MVLGTGCVVLIMTSDATLRVRYAETDKMGVVYHSNFIVWFEVGRQQLHIGVQEPLD